MRIANTLRGSAVALVIAALAATPLRAADSVTIGTVGSASANLWPVFIGLSKGFFTEQNVKADLVYIPSSAQVITQLTSGSLDVTMSTGLVDPIRAIDKGSPIAIVRLEAQSPPYALVAKPAIKSLAELKGKLISVGGPKDITRIYVERILPPYNFQAVAQGFNELGLTVDYAPELPFSGTVVNLPWAKAHQDVMARVL